MSFGSACHDVVVKWSQEVGGGWQTIEPCGAISGQFVGGTRSGSA
jgi:hypothetical protein